MSLPIPVSDLCFRKEYWMGNSRDGAIKNGEGYHYYKMSPSGTILEAYEMYETDDGDQIVSPLPEMLNINWTNDLGFLDLEILDDISEYEFQSMKELVC